MATSAPMIERGALTNVAALSTSWTRFEDELEHTRKLLWPFSVDVYARMLNDSQIGALRQAVTLPLLRREWMIDPNGAPDHVVDRVSRSLGLPVLGRDRGHRARGRGRFQWGAHLSHVLRAPFYGHYFFEQVYDKPETTGGPISLRKLAPRPPYTVSEINVDPRDGGLTGIKQAFGLQAGPQIPVSALVAYVWDQEGGNWVGRSMLRSVYREWLVKDRLLRVDAINHERAGGVPVVEAQQGASEQDMERLHALAASFRVGERAGGALPNGAKLQLVKGASSTVMDSVRYLDESAARSFLAMFLMLGSTSSGGLNGTGMTEQFTDFFAMGLDAIAEWVCDTTTDHVIEDDVDWNEGESVEYVPRLVAHRAEHEHADASTLATLVDRGLLTVDAELEDVVRSRYDLPARPDTLPIAAPTAAAAERDGKTRRVTTAAASAVKLPARDLRREPLPFEVTAAVDFASMDTVHTSAMDALVAAWQRVRADQIDELAALIEAAAGDPAKLAAIQATAAGADVLVDRLRGVAAQGIDGALAEAAAQGATVAAPAVDDVMSALSTRAAATAILLARSLSEAAGRRALSLTGGSLTASDVAGQVREHLDGLSDAYLRDQLGGLLTQAQHAGRRAVFDAAPAIRAIYASELLDTNTCDPCAERDGSQYASLAEAEADYPTGGYADCLGGPRCRGTLVCIYGDEAAPSVQ